MDIAIVVFARDLRLHDNPALHQACRSRPHDQEAAALEPLASRSPREPRPLHGACGFRRAVPRIAHHQHQRRGRHGRPASVGTMLRPPPWLTAAATPTAANTARAASP